MSAPSASGVSDSERALSSAIADMLAQPEYLLPLVAAQRQYREHYYGLSSAALLEDLFHDAFANHLALTRPDVSFRRPERGQKGWDYAFEDLEVSHKVGLGPESIAALWDATTVVDTWSFTSPIVFLSAASTPVRGVLRQGGRSRYVSTSKGRPDELVRAGRRVWVVDWAPSGEVDVMWTATAPGGAALRDILPFSEVWKVIAPRLRQGIPASRFEILCSTAGDSKSTPTGPSAGESLRLDFDHRSGVYVIPVSLLQEVPVASNSRAVLLSKALVAERMRLVRDAGLFTPLPLWFRSYVQSRPPDLYLTQRASFDALFSPATGSA